MPAPKSIAELRADLARRFPTAPRVAGRVLPTAVAAIDDITGGLPLSAITEIVCATPSCGGHLLLQQLLTLTRRDRQRVALIDSTDSFDPASAPVDLLAHLVWVRCGATTLALQAADLLTRDANFGLVVLDLRRAPESELRRVPSPQWYRLQRAAEPTDLALVILTPRAAVPSAQLRLALTASHAFSTLEQERPALIAQLTPALQRQRLASNAAS